MDFQANGLIQATCDHGLAPWLRQELERLGARVRREHRTGVELEGSLLDCMRLNLTSRFAFNILYQLSEFRCASPDDLYREVAALPWEQVLPVDGHFSVVSRVSDNPQIRDTRFPSLRVKDAVVDRIVRHCGARPNSGKERDGAVVHLNWHGERAWIYVNTSGNKLSDRGYRRMPWAAPLRETLAAALLAAANYDGRRPLVNPMCGSGTLAIEAALIARNTAPGLLRDNFGFRHLIGFPAAEYDALRAELRRAVRRGPYPKIIANDLAPQALAAARQNARTAGVDAMIEFLPGDFAQLTVPECADAPQADGPKGVVIVNPEYGERMGEIEPLAGEYERLGDWLKQRCTGWEGYIFTGNLDLAKKVGLRAARRFEFHNGAIDCRLLRYELY